jgi:serine/threonine protein kinase
MSPEQAKGRAVGKRTDIFGFGCMLFEMLTGRAAFEGEDIPDILSRVLQREPDWSLLPPAVPPRIRELLQLCLHKDVRKRRSDAADVRLRAAHQAPTRPTPPAGMRLLPVTTLTGWQDWPSLSPDGEQVVTYTDHYSW